MLGHVQQLSGERVTGRVYDLDEKSARAGGRLCFRWFDGVKNSCQQVHWSWVAQKLNTECLWMIWKEVWMYKLWPSFPLTRIMQISNSTYASLHSTTTYSDYRVTQVTSPKNLPWTVNSPKECVSVCMRKWRCCTFLLQVKSSPPHKLLSVKTAGVPWYKNLL